jgi:outer membrane immunogenic protein
MRGFDGISPYLVGFPTGAGLAATSYGPMTQSGFIGGGQIGYNYQWGSNFVIGLEADMQGTGIRGRSHVAGIGGSSSTSPLFVLKNTDVLLQADSAESKWDPRYLGINNSANSIGATTVNAGVDWLGTVRGRLGYLFTPTMLLYATGGLTYGGVYANVNQWGNTNLQISLVNTKTNDTLLGPLGTNHTFIGGGNKSQVLVGWNVGGGIEWMFMPNWSIKAEGIYWNMGNMNVPTTSFASAPITGINTPLSVTNPMSTIGAVRVNYQGVIARMGVNYHFNWFAPAPVVAKY